MPVDIDKIGDLLEDNKGHPDGQGDVSEDKGIEMDRGQEMIDVLHKKVCILEIHQQAHIRQNSDGQIALSDGLPVFMKDGIADEPIEESGEEDDADKCGFAPGIEQEACKNNNDVAKAFPCKKVQCEKEGHKTKQEERRIEKHMRYLRLFKMFMVRRVSFTRWAFKTD